MAASSSELSLKGGIGYARARKIRELLDAEYRQLRQTQIELPRV
jgi:ERCC4-type nuclease